MLARERAVTKPGLKGVQRIRENGEAAPPFDPSREAGASPRVRDLPKVGHLLGQDVVGRDELVEVDRECNVLSVIWGDPERRPGRFGLKKAGHVRSCCR